MLVISDRSDFHPLACGGPSGSASTLLLFYPVNGCINTLLEQLIERFLSHSDPPGLTLDSALTITQDLKGLSRR